MNALCLLRDSEAQRGSEKMSCNKNSERRSAPNGRLNPWLLRGHFLASAKSVIHLLIALGKLGLSLKTGEPCDGAERPPPQKPVFLTEQCSILPPLRPMLE